MDTDLGRTLKSPLPSTSPDLTFLASSHLLRILVSGDPIYFECDGLILKLSKVGQESTSSGD